MSAPLVSVCVANYQGRDLIESCLNSIFSQKCDFEFEVIVYDDASTDASDRTVINCFPKARLIREEKNVGYCIANHRMAENACGKYLLLFNNDASLMPGSLQALANEARAIKSPAILGLPQYDAVTKTLEDRGRLCDPFLNCLPNYEKNRNEVAMVAGACLWLPRETWFELGGFPEWFEYTAEDLYICLAARMRGYRVSIVDDGHGFYHHIGQSIGGGKIVAGRLSTTYERRFRTERNKCAVILACYPSPWHYCVFIMLAILLLLEGCTIALVKKNSKILSQVYLRALRGVWKSRQKIFEMRRKNLFGVISNSRFFSQFVWTPYKAQLVFRYGFPDLK